MLALVKFQIVEQPEGLGFLVVANDAEVLADADVVVNAPVVEIAQPFAPDELPVGHHEKSCAMIEVVDKCFV